jgi:hypothetical protein
MPRLVDMVFWRTPRLSPISPEARPSGTGGDEQPEHGEPGFLAEG